ncbi:putative phosphatase [BD1-7 clade bacterium]|uniref:Putative phosphatase n=1 Tax=BD1-7 clade bacterium TaxID=2029982 RepID=A0A5S9P4H0_9GAMM|nr:putative phosphatase [BD1-7 clade bacterium]CAA0098477.1 putative phosphatase [BD1-7 clade bacterium]
MDTLTKSLQEFVVFDFDNTIVAMDTATSFHEWLIRRSVWRSAAIVPAFPLMQMLRRFDTSRKWGLNIGCYLATVNQAGALADLMNEFIADVFVPKRPVFVDALAVIDEHRQAGRHVVVISGCPQWLLDPVVEALALPVDQVIGSTSAEQNDARLLDILCYGEAKLDLARDAGLNFSYCHSCYSDCLSDLPMLLQSRYPFLVNLAEEDRVALPDDIAARIKCLAWQETYQGSA